MEKKSTKIAYFVALGVFVVLLVILGITFKGAPLPTLEVDGEMIEATTPFAGTFWSLLPPIVAIVLALISKEVYSSLFLGCLVGALLVSNFHPWETVVQLVEGDNGIVTTVSGYVNSESVSGIEMFIKQIPWNYYCLLTLLMIVVISLLNIDYGPMLTHEYNAQVKGDLFTTPERPFEGADDYEVGSKGKSSVLDLLLPVIVLIITCIVGLIYTGGYYDTESGNYHAFMNAFSDASSGQGLAIGSMIALVFTFVYFWLRGSIGFEKSFECVPQGFIQMIAPILILTFAWTLCGLTRFGMYSANFVTNAMAGAGELKIYLPAVIFIIGCAIGFATGTSWGTIGIMAPIVVSVFNYDVEPILCTIGLAAACSGGVMGDHCSPISDTTIMASAGAHCFHLNHVFTQMPYALTVSGVAFVSFILAGLIQNVVINLILACVLMVGTLLVIKVIVAKKHAGIFEEMAEANKALAHQK